MQGCSPNGDCIWHFGHLRFLSIVQEFAVEVNAKEVNKYMEAFNVPCRGDIAFTSGSNVVKTCHILRNLLHFHETIFGTRVQTVDEESFTVFLPLYEGIFERIELSVLEYDENSCGRLLKKARMDEFREKMSPEDFFKHYPHTTCPYPHGYNDEIDDVESTCTLCEEFQISRARLNSRLRSRSRGTRSRSRSRSRLIFSCQKCGVALGDSNPRQLCQKTFCGGV